MQADSLLPADEKPPVFDRAEDHLPWPQDDVLPVDDDGNVLPGADDIDDDPNDNGDLEPIDIPDVRPSDLPPDPPFPDDAPALI